MATKKKTKTQSRPLNGKPKTKTSALVAPVAAKNSEGKAKPAVGPGADRALFEYAETFRWGHVGASCKCENRGRCPHSNGLNSLAWEMFCKFKEYEPEKYKDYDMPAELEAFRKETLTKESALKKLTETIFDMLPKAKRRQLHGLFDRYQREFDTFKQRFFIAVSYARGLTDHEDLTGYRLCVVEQLIKDVKNKKDRPYYDRVYTSPWYDLTDEQLKTFIEKDQNHVQPGDLANNSFYQMDIALTQEADNLQRQFRKTGDVNLMKRKLDLLETGRRLREQEKFLPSYE